MNRLAFLGSMFLIIALVPPAHAGGAWTGFYAGVNAGYAWGSANNTLSIVDGPAITNCHFCGVSSGGSGNDAGVAQSAGSPSFNPNGFIGGSQAGYNRQNGNWVYGVEVDFESFSQNQSVNSSFGLPANTATSTSCASGGLPVNCTGNVSTSINTDWLLTFRPRIGYGWDSTLVYVTGGLALTKISFSQSYSDNINFGNSVGGSASTSASQMKAGWVVGGGLEHSIGNNWSMKAEYLYVRFDGLSAGGTLTDSIPGDFANFTNNLDHLSSNIVRVGINYRLAASP
jgi:outer membrane immunogenic protein